MTTAEHTRKTLIALARRRQRPGRGSGLVFLRERSCTMQWPDLSAIFEDVRFAVVGAVATRLYMPERATADIDVTILAEDFEAARRKLRDANWQILGELSIGGETWRSERGETVDVIEGRAGWWAGAIEQAQSNRDAQNLPIIPFPFLVLMKFQSSRTVDIGDITRMLGLADEVALQHTREIFKRFEPQGLEDLESLIELGKLEMNE